MQTLLITSRFILPLLGEYVDSGYRAPRDRVLYSLRSNAQYYLIVLSCGILGLVYLFFQHGFHTESVKSLVMALAYCVGLIQAVLLLGHGLVAVPRHLFRSAGNRLRRLQTRAPKLHDKLDDAVIELQDLNHQLEQLKMRKNGLSRDMEEWVEDLADTGPYALLDSTSLPTSSRNNAVPAVVTDRYLADLGRRLNRARHKVIRFTYTWNRLVQEATDTQAAIDSVASKRLEFQKDSSRPRILQIPMVTPHVRYLLHTRIYPGTRIAFGGVLALASLSIIWSELVKFAAPQISMISITVVRYVEGEPKVGFGGQLLSFLWILYMCTCTLSSLQDVKVWGNRALVRRNTYGESACWYACQVAKLTVPLTYNFLTFTPRNVHQKTKFYNFLGKLIVLTPLGKGFDYFFPMLILIPAAATLFNVYSRAKKLLGYGIIDHDDEDSSPFGTGTWREGRDLIEREIQDRASSDSAALLNRHPGESAGESPPSQSSNRPSRVPTMYIPPPEESRTAQRQAERLTAATEAAVEHDENFFSDFAHRVRNTFDNVERPDWLPDFGKRPKWMGGENRDGPDQGSGSNDNIGRWFGGRSENGRIRLG